MIGFLARLIGLIALAASFGCGEFETLVLPEFPPRGDFVDAQAVMITVGCSGNNAQGCHRNLIADFKVTGEPKEDASREDELILTKGKINLQQPEQSILLRVALRGDAKSRSHPICFSSPDSCAYRKLISWIQWGSESDDRPSDIDCQVEEDACFANDSLPDP